MGRNETLEEAGGEGLHRCCDMSVGKVMGERATPAPLTELLLAAVPPSAHTHTNETKSFRAPIIWGFCFEKIALASSKNKLLKRDDNN